MLIIFKKISLITILLLSLSFACSAINEPEVSASSAVLIDGDTLEVLYEKNSREKRSMASTTKIMTTILAIESGKLDSIITVKDKIYIEGTAIGLNKGDQFTLETLCYAMLLESGNDAAVQTAVFISGSEQKFSLLMNKKASEIGMKDTNFVTASGLDDENHYTTAHDMALLGAYAISDSQFREMSSCKSYKAEFITPATIRYFSNHNRLLNSCDGIIGIKTGFTKKSGRCLVSACERNGKILVAVTLNAPDDWNDHKKIYDYGYSLYEKYKPSLTTSYDIPVFGSDKRSEVEISLKNSSEILILKNSNIETKVYHNSFLYAPISENDIVGKLVVYQNGQPIKTDYLISNDKAPVSGNFKIYEPGLKQRLIEFIRKLFK